MSRSRILLLAVSVAILTWITDTAVDYLVFQRESMVAHLTSNVLPHELYMRTLISGLGFAVALLILMIVRARRINQLLTESEARYRTLFTQCPDGIAIMDSETMLPIDFNTAMVDLLGYDRDEYMQLKVTDYEVSKSPEETRAHFESLFRTGMQVFDTRLRCKSGEIKEVQVNVRNLQLSGRTVFHSVVQDITKRTHLERELRESREQYKILFERAPVAIFRTSVENDAILSVNDRGVELFGYRTKEEFISAFTSLRHFVNLSDRDDLLRKLRLHGEIDNGQARFRRCDGTEIWVEYSAQLHLLEGYIETAAVDITERKDSEERLAEYQNRLRVMGAQFALADERNRRHLAVQLHDLVGQPILLANMKLSETCCRCVSDVCDQKLAEIRALLKEAVRQTRAITFELSPPILYELGLPDAVGWLCERMQESHGIQTECRVTDEPLLLTQDAQTTLFHATRELLMNVVKHARASRATVTLKREGDRVQVVIADDGIGFDGTVTKCRPEESGGFGLFSIRERLGLLGGRLDIEMSPDPGARIVMTVPLEPEPAA